MPHAMLMHEAFYYPNMRSLLFYSLKKTSLFLMLYKFAFNKNYYLANYSY